MLLERRVQFRNQMVQRIDARNDLRVEYSRTLVLLSTHSAPCAQTIPDSSVLRVPLRPWYSRA